MKHDSLVFLGEPLFRHGSLHRYLLEAVRAKAISGYANMPRRGRAFSKLRLRRYLGEGARVGHTISLTPGTTVEVMGIAGDGRRRAEHRSLITGTPDLLQFAPGDHPVAPPLLARIEDNQLVLIVTFTPPDWRYVSALVQHQLERLLALTAALRSVIEVFDRDLPQHIKQVVAEEWPRLHGSRVPHG